jgi:glucokinase
MRVLAADIGGTSARLALIEVGDGPMAIRDEQTYPSGKHAGLEEIVAAFTANHPSGFEASAFGIAGPIQDGRVASTNLPWVIDSRALARQLGLRHVGLLNDLAATAHGIGEIPESEFLVLNAGAPVRGSNAAVLSAGTGLGEAGLLWNGTRHQPVASEGGHADFAPRNELEIGLLIYLTARYGRVSYERVLSGPGLVNIYEYLRDSGRGAEQPFVLERMREHGAAAAISETALQARCGLCEQALEIFVSCYGAEAGNLGLRYLAHHGVYLGGGIAPKIAPALTGPHFMAAFTAKGRLSPLVAAMPVRVILNEKVGLLGAARFATLQA